MTFDPIKMGVQDFREAVAAHDWKCKITSVHWHHTYQPDHAAFRQKGGLLCVMDMHRFHTVTRGWRHMGQHVTIDPEGFIWTGRPWDWAPASATGHNGTEAAHPFMFEMIGDFRKGRDPLTGGQLEAALAVTSSIQMRFGLPETAMHFHKEMQPTECPGDIVKPHMIDAVAKMRLALEREELLEPYAPLRALWERAQRWIR